MGTIVMFGSFGCAACSHYPLLFHFDSCNFYILYSSFYSYFIYLFLVSIVLSLWPRPPSTHWVVPRALFIKLVKRSCPVPVTDTLSGVSFSLAVGALYKLYYYYYYYDVDPGDPPCPLKSIFLNSMSASIKKKVSQNRKSCNKTNNNKRPFFLRKINKVFLRPILQNLKEKVRFGQIFENDPLDEPNQMPPSKKFFLFRKMVKNAKW